MRHRYTVFRQVIDLDRFQLPNLFNWRRLLATCLIALTLAWGLPTRPAIAQEVMPDAPSIQPYLDRVAERVTEFSLDNGMRFLVLERHQAPVVSFMTYVDVGAAYEEDGKTGAAHYLEHLAFKGTSDIGTKDYTEESALLDRLDTLFADLKVAEAAGDSEQVEQLRAEFEDVRSQAAEFVERNEYGRIVERAGGVGLNATTSADATRYFYSFPSNKLELWMSLESERFLDPVFREFFEEKDVILEERRMRTDNSPIGQMIEAFLETAFPNYPYGRPIIGYADDLYNMTRDDIQDFFDAYYSPSHIVMAIVGDVEADEVQRLAELYFGRYEPRPEVGSLSAELPEPVAESREVTLNLPSEPWYLQGYYRPDIKDPDDAVYQVINGILTSGRTSRLYQTLVEDEQVALDIGSANGFPGDSYPTLMLLYGLTAPNHTVDEVEALLNQELEKLTTEFVSPEELDRIKTQARAGVLRSLSSNRGMASLLAEYEAKTGDWRNLFNQVNAIESVSQADVLRVAQETFRPENLTVGRILTSDASESESMDGREPSM